MSRLDSINAKLERAEKHIRDLNTALYEFLNAKPGPYEVISEKDHQTKHRIYRIASMRDVPLPTVCIFGDAIHALRSALDHLAWQLVLANNNTPDSQTAFPIFEDASEYEARSPRKIQGMGDEAKEWLRAIKPYKTGQRFLWQLHRLDIIDKHRMVITAGTQFVGHTPSPSTAQSLTEGFRSIMPGSPVPDFSKMLVTPAIPVNPLKPGDIILTVPEAEVQENMDFRFTVSLNEPEIFERQTVIQSVEELKNIVNSTVFFFAKLL